MEMQSAAQSGTGSKNDPQSQKPAQVYHINLDQPQISQASAGPTGGPQKPQVTMEKIGDRSGGYHVEVKHDGPPGHGPPPQQHLPEGVVYTPLIQGMPLHPNAVMQMTANSGQVCKLKFFL